MEARGQAMTPFAYPSLREAAAMLGVAAPTLSRLPDLRYIRAGGRDHRIPAGEVLRLTQHFRRRSLEEVAFQLIDYSKTHALGMESAVTAEVDEYLSQSYRATPEASLEQFLRDARKLLPASLFNQVARAALADDINETKRRAAASTKPKVSRGRKPVASSKSSRNVTKKRVRQPA
jgi:hypothetical protein